MVERKLRSRDVWSGQKELLDNVKSNQKENDDKLVVLQKEKFSKSEIKIKRKVIL